MSYAEGYDPLGGIAIIGMAGRFPGAHNIAQFWQNLQAGEESISFFTAEELEPSALEPMSVRNDPNYVRARGVMTDAESFDAAFFSIPPREAELMDPQQRVFLETAWEALEHAGHDPQRYRGATGVFAGMSNNTYFPAIVAPHRDTLELANSLQTMMGNEKDYVATRVSYKFDLRGPSLNIQTACSTSLVAVSQAFHSLLSYQCDMALAGAVSVSCPQRRGYVYHEGAIVSPDGHCRAFDARAQGTVFSNGVGVVVLKRLVDALEDGDAIYAVIKGVGVNNDGSARVSFAAPSVDGQAEAIAMAQAFAGIDPETISYVEAHGTGTALGDPIEIAALTQAFRLNTDKRGFCALGSVKTNIGHLDVAAGVAGLIKTALALQQKMLPASLHFTQPNPKIDFANSPFYVNTMLQEWRAEDTPRRAGVSSFGSGGTNAHVVLEEAPPSAPTDPARAEQLLVLSARTETALEQATANLLTHLQEYPQLPVADVAYTLQTGRRAFAHRRVVVCRERNEAISALQTRDPKRVEARRCEQTDTPVAFLFPGQGAQYVNMGKGLYREERLFFRQVSECAEVLRPHLGLDIRTILYPIPAQSEAATRQLTQTFITQPVLFVIEYALAQVWAQWGVAPQAMIGHSLGEYVAACLANVLSRDDALRLLAGRARLMQALPPGAMLAVRLPEEEVASRLGAELSIAALNGPSLTVVSGPHEAIHALEEELSAAQVACRRLPTSHAFHSHMLDPMLQPFADLVRGVPLNPPRLPWISSLTGQWITPNQATDPDYWVQQLRRPVRCVDGIQLLLQNSQQMLLEVGPGSTLSSLAKQQPRRSPTQEIVSSLHPERDEALDLHSMLRAVGRLWLSGAPVDWRGVHDHQRRQRVPLPTYPFERRRFWLEPPQHLSPPTQEAESGSQSISTFVTSAIQETPETEAGTTQETAMSDTPTVSLVSSHRYTEVLAKLQALFSDISGIEAAALDAATPFLELGLDSLLLTQASTAMQKAFGVKVTFRQLLEDLSTLEALATRLVQTLPPTTQPVEPPADSVPMSPALNVSQEPAPQLQIKPSSGQPSEPLGVPEAEGQEPGALERLFAQQLALMSRQLDLLQNRPRVLAAEPSQNGASKSLASAHITAPARQQLRSSAVIVPSRPAAAANTQSQAFGPYKPVHSKSSTHSLTPRQQQHLDALISRYTERTQESKRLTAQHRRHLADPRSVAGFRLPWKEMVYPLVTTRSAGAKLWDVDGNEYIDLTNGFGSILFGHRPAFVTTAIEEQLKKGMEIGPQSPLAGQVADLLCEMTGMERATFCNTGSEAVTAALRMARTVTERDKIALFSGAYHGIFDEVLVRSTIVNGAPKPRPIAPGIPANMVENVLVLDYGSPASLDLLRAQGHDLAAVLVEPVQSRRPELQPKDFLHSLREITTKTGAALICDEIVTGFRVHPGGAQAVFGIQADIATYGKVLGGGLPIGIVAGNAKFMDALDGGAWNYGDDSAPEVGMTFFAGTFVRHPLALAAARACLLHLKEHSPELQRLLNQRTTRLVEALSTHAKHVHAPIHIPHFGSSFCFNFPTDLPYAWLFFAYMREKGLHMWEGRPSFLTTAHTDEDLERVIVAFKESIAAMQEAEFLPGSSHDHPPIPGARLGKDQQGNPAWFVPDSERPGKYLQLEESV
jgi:acyl transferase domain-containing protein